MNNSQTTAFKKCQNCLYWPISTFINDRDRHCYFFEELPTMMCDRYAPRFTIKPFYNLAELIKDPEDWNAAYNIAAQIYFHQSSVFDEDSDAGFFKTLAIQILANFILLVSQTQYPDLKSVKAILTLPQLQSRLASTFVFDKPNQFSKATNEAFYFLLNNYPENSKILQTIIVVNLQAIANYLNILGEQFTHKGYEETTNYLKELFPISN